MKIILKSYVDNLGDAGDIVDVANGYANNYLIPQDLAMRATKGAVADAQAIRRARMKREAVEIAEAEELKSGVQGRVLNVSATAGEDGTLYGSVNARDIAELFSDKTGIQVDHKRVVLDRPLKSVGRHEVGIKLHRSVVADVIIDIAADQIIESGAEDLEDALAEGVEATPGAERPAEAAQSDEATSEETTSDEATSDETTSDATTQSDEAPEPATSTDSEDETAQAG